MCQRCVWEKNKFMSCWKNCLFGDCRSPRGSSYNCMAHFSLWHVKILSRWLYINIIKQLSSLRDKQSNGNGNEGNFSSIKMQTAPAPLGVQISGRSEERRRRRINEERRKWNERTGEDGLVALIKVWIFTTLSSPRLNTNYSQQLLNELAKTHYHNVLHVYHFRNTELHC